MAARRDLGFKDETHCVQDLQWVITVSVAVEKLGLKIEIPPSDSSKVQVRYLNANFTFSEIL